MNSLVGVPPTRLMRVVHVEDNAMDVELTRLALERAGFHADWQVVETEADLIAALTGAVDIVLSDYLLPTFSGAAALDLAARLAPGVPFIFLSGVMGEETAVDMMRRGATDYIVKQRLSLLPASIARALTLVDERRRRERAEQALVTSRINTQLAAESAQLGMWDFRPISGELIWDVRCREMFGLAPDAAVTLSTFEMGVHPDDRGRMMELIAHIIHSPAAPECNTDFRVVHPDGTLRWINTCGRAFFHDGLCTHFVGVVMDVTERHQNAEAMTRLNAALEELVALRTSERDRVWTLSDDLLAVFHPDLTPVSLNPAWSNALGLSESLLLDGPLYRYIAAEDAEAARSALARLLPGLTVRFETRLQGARHQHWLSWTVAGADALLFCVVRDVTAEKARLAELASANQQLRDQIAQRQRMEATLQKMQRLEAVGRLTAGVAHDFNNLLTVVLSNAGFVERDLRNVEVGDKTRQRLQNIASAAKSGARLTHQLLSFSRQQQLATQAVNLNALIGAMLDLLASSLGGTVQLETRLADDLWTGFADPTQVEMVILNLAINARDASAEGGRIVLSSWNASVAGEAPQPGAPVPGDYVCLAVEDQGHGMTAEVMSQAFEPFFTTKEVGKGSGLGLAQVYGFAIQSGGGVTLSSEPEHGTRVVVYLPRWHANAAPAEAPSAPLADTAFSPLTVLMVDDDPLVRLVNAQHLQDLGHQVLVADSGEAGLALLAASPKVDALVADYAMPGMNGAEFARRARVQQPQLPVVFVTGYIEHDQLDLPNTTIVQKPYTAALLGQQLNQLLARS
ncbi:response regulator [Chitinolyticbacter meiyuanensis]|uniref:response regulator n=1 Tax=Chitinolyticbacter meiyuanensis TaxID=682798 RepID=UPI0011E5D0D6|nr:response regulator [Chitinolyticbacter meiyuanensis]